MLVSYLLILYAKPIRRYIAGIFKKNLIWYVILRQMVIEICLPGAERCDLIIRLDERRVLQMCWSGIFINLLREGKLSLIGGINMFSIWRRDRPQTDVGCVSALWHLAETAIPTATYSISQLICPHATIRKMFTNSANVAGRWHVAWKPGFTLRASENIF